MSGLVCRWAALFGTEAWAAGSFDCLFGGWASKQSNGKCLSPSRVNPIYQKLFQAAGCEKDGFLCAPALFGTKLCLEAKRQIAYNPNQTVNNEKTRDLIRSTYQSCKSAASKRKLEDVAKDITDDPDTYSTLEQTEQAMAMACFNQDHFQFGRDMCESAKVRLASIKKEFIKQFPDQIAAGQCYFDLDDMRKCSVQAPDWMAANEQISRDWRDRKAKEGKPRYWGCGYFGVTSGSSFAGIMAFRDPESDAVYVRSPARSWFQAGKFQATESFLYKMPGAKLSGAKEDDGVRDVRELAGALPADVAKLEYFDHPAVFGDVYRAMLNEITLQMGERAKEYKNSSNSKLKAGLADVIRSCAKVTDPRFQEARAGACAAIGIQCTTAGAKAANSKSDKGD